MSWMGSLAGLTGSLVSGGLNYFGAQEQNRQIQEANKANVGIAREQMAFQERMSSSAYQRAVADMKKAGINPMVAFQQGGASSPSGSSAVMQARKPVATQVASSALDFKRMEAEVENVRAQTEQRRLENRLLDLSTPGAEIEASIDRTWLGQLARLFARYNPSVSSAANLAKSVMLGGRRR